VDIGIGAGGNMPSLHKDPKNPHALVVEAPYDQEVLASLKAIVPSTDRTWDPNDKVWLISSRYGQAVANILKARWPNFRADVTFSVFDPQEEERIIEMEYIGVTKDRENGQESAFGYVKGEWSYIFPRNVLEGFFTGYTGYKSFPREPSKTTTLYAILQIDRIATQMEIKHGYRRMARIWHPDINKEPNANDMFIQIQQAYDKLNNPKTRAKYDLGLKLEAGMKKHDDRQHENWLEKSSKFGYRSPLTCGMLHVNIKPGARNQVTKIHKWEDIKNSQGEILVTSWKKDATTFTRSWA
jgi:hypothetical protein